MLLIVFLFITAFIFSVALTPRVSAVAERFNLLDRPSSRKVHRLAIPRIGGVAIFLGFFMAIGCGIILSDFHGTPFIQDKKILYIFLGGAIAFSLGFYDDLRHLGPKTKFAIQIIAAMFAYAGGLHIETITLPFLGSFHFGVLSLPITIFWVLLVINAINLIDGLDGLAAGVSFLVCIVLLALSLRQGHVVTAFILAALAGSILGFLIFNFNPASIFMGDSGSYFIGYMLASLSILGSMKSHATFTFLVPIIVLGVPLLDTIWATVRRFILGQKLFFPDKNHFHHRLLSLGYSHRRAVLILYGITIFLGCVSLLMTNVSDTHSSVYCAIILVLLVVFIKRLGYVDFIGIKSLLSWMNDIVNALGINRDRRVFFGYQMALNESPDIPTLTERLIATAQYLGLDYIEFRLGGRDSNFKKFDDFSWASAADVARDKYALYATERLYMRFPLRSGEEHFGVMIVSKKSFDSEQSHSQTLWRLEFLRRTVSSTLQNLKHSLPHELCDRRVRTMGNRRMNRVKTELIQQLREKRVNGGDRRMHPQPKAVPEKRPQEKGESLPIAVGLQKCID